jgi:hypothetical protein
VNKGVPQPQITIGKEQESIHEKEHQLKFHLSPFYTWTVAEAKSGYSIEPNHPLRTIHLTNSSTGTMVTASPPTISQSTSGRE